MLPLFVSREVDTEEAGVELVVVIPLIVAVEEEEEAAVDDERDEEVTAVGDNDVEDDEGEVIPTQTSPEWDDRCFARLLVALWIISLESDPLDCIASRGIPRTNKKYHSTHAEREREIKSGRQSGASVTKRTPGVCTKNGTPKRH
jgi:hypothetical protein